MIKRLRKLIIRARLGLIEARIRRANNDFQRLVVRHSQLQEPAKSELLNGKMLTVNTAYDRLATRYIKLQARL